MCFRSLVFQRAYISHKECGMKWQDALKDAWARYREFRDETAAKTQEAIDSFDEYYERTDDARVRRYWSGRERAIRDTLKRYPFLKSRMKLTKRFK